MSESALLVSPVVTSVTTPITNSVDGGTADSIYAVLRFEPQVALDFVNEYYRTTTSTTTLSNAVTHARSSNATMTDGYGPELVTNGTFDTDDGWYLNGFTIANGVLSKVSGTGNSKRALFPATIENGKTYEITFNYTDNGANLSVGFATTTTSSSLGAGAIAIPEGTGRKAIYLTATADGASFGFRGHNAYAGVVDNVSVREMPVIKWAPHNVTTYSEEFDNADWAKSDASISENTAVAPNSTQTADKLVEGTALGFKYVNSPNSAFAVTEGMQITISCFIKADERTWCALGISKTSGTPFAGSAFTARSAYFNLSTGAAGTVGSSLSSSSITDVGNGWYLCSITGTAIASGNITPLITIALGDGNASYTGDGSSGIYLWGAHLFRSDLGGMVDNPDRGDSYVPTTSAAKYLPRVGHHVYNGSAWVNEGVLAESESRTNLVAYNNDLSNAGWIKVQLNVTANSATAPDGTDDAWELAETTSTTPHYAYAPSQSFTSGNAYTISAFMKAGTKSLIQLAGTSSGFGNTLYGNFDLANGVVGSAASGVVSTMEDVGNGWYRSSITGDATATATGTAAIVVIIDSLSSGRVPSFAGNSSNNVYVYGFQTEEASTPSSLIPTSGSTVTRAAETFTIPSANLPWPEPQYIGDELVTNGTFDSDVSGWSGVNSATVTFNSGRAEVDIAAVSGSGVSSDADVSVEAGKVYLVSADVEIGTYTGSSVILNLIGSNSPSQAVAGSGVTTVSYVFYGSTTTNTSVRVLRGSADTGTIYVDNVSVREINPLSVSIGMEGRMTYADNAQESEVTFVGWPSTGAVPYIRTVLRTNGSYVGAFRTIQYDGTTADSVSEAVSGSYSPDILVPYNIASRHGSTFINGAVDGVALTANTTPTALPDLSSTDLSLAYKYMGTISEFRVWDRDITDDGLEEATNPSLEPSLSLTFEGTGTNSFTVSDWSE